MSVDLDVPLFIQPASSYECGQHCAKMVLAFFGKVVTIRDISRLCKYTRNGTFDMSIAVALSSCGVDPILYTYPDDDVFEVKHLDMSAQKLRGSFERRARKSKGIMRKRIFSDVATLSSENRIKFEPPTPLVLRRELDKGKPWIISLSTGCIYKEETGGPGHFVVIRGYENDSLLINDPLKGKWTMPADLISYANARMDGMAISIGQTNA